MEASRGPLGLARDSRGEFDRHVHGFRVQPSGVKDIAFHLVPAHGMALGNNKTLDVNLKVSDVKAREDGRTVTATVQVMDAAVGAS